MQKRLYLLLLLLMACTSWAAAQTYTLTLGGAVTETGSGNPIANLPMYIYVDSMSTGGFSHFSSVTTDASGNYSATVTIPGTFGGGDAEVYTYDCNGNYVSTGFISFTTSNSTFNALDFQICPFSSTGCGASFQAYHSSGTTIYNFTNYSTAGSPISSIVSYAWDFGDGSTSTQVNPSHAYNSLGQYVVCLSIVTNTGCTDSYCDTINLGVSGTCFANFQYSQSPSASCTYSFYDSSFATTGVSYNIWDFGDGTVVYGTNPMHTYTAPGVYQVCNTVVALDSCRDTYCASLVVAACTTTTPPCIAQYYWYPDSSGSYSVILVNTSSGPGSLSYLWDFGDGNTSTLPYPSHTYAGAGTYAICVTVTSNGPTQCSATYCDTLQVLNRMSVPFSINVISGAVANDAPEFGQVEMTLVPNPAQDQVRLQYSTEQSGVAGIRMIDLQGRVVRNLHLGEVNAGTHTQTIDVQDLPAGLYMTEFTIGDQRKVKKLVIAD